jgi:hypothetical protein
VAIFLQTVQSADDDLYNTPISVLDAGELYRKCLENGFATDWWSPLANTVRMVCGEAPNTAYLLLTKRQLFGDDASNPVMQLGS